MAHAQHSSFRPMAEVPFRPARQLSEYKGKGASASREEQQALNKFSSTEGRHFLAIPRKIDTGSPVIVVALSVFQDLQMFRNKSDAL